MATADYAAADLRTLTQELDRGAITSAELIAEFRARVAEVDRAGPTLRSIIETSDAADAVAAVRDRERAQGGALRGPLHGLPVVVKDNIDTADDMLTTAGSLALMDSRPAADAPIVARLRAAGAIIVGKANLSEWANFRSTNSTSGWSARGGLVRNPYVLDRSAGGSSSGSGAAVAAGIAPVAIGTETDGSIICPAALCGVVGIKPTVGLTSRTGVIPISTSQDSVGPLTRTVHDAALVLTVMADHAAVDYAVGLDRGVEDVRVGIARTTAWGADANVDALAEQAVSALSQAGAVVVDDANLPSAAELADDEDEFTVLKYEFKAAIATYLATRPDGAMQSLSDLIEFNRAHADVELAHFGQEMFEQAEETTGLHDPVYVGALQRSRRRGRKDGIDAALERQRVDVLIAPAYPPAWPADLAVGDPDDILAASAPAAVAGYPIVSVPIGLVDGLPVGLAIFGTARSEPTLLRVAAAVERALGPVEPPAYRSSVGGPTRSG